MKNILCILFVMIILMGAGAFVCTASETDTPTDTLSDTLKTDELYDKLPDYARRTLEQMGISKISPDTLTNVSFDGLVKGIVNIAAEQGGDVLSATGVIAGIILLCSLFEGISESVNTSLREVLSVASALCMTSVLVIPVSGVIETANDTIKNASDFMLAYIPIMVAVLMSCGQSISGSGYYSLMIFAAEGISQLSGKFITPLLNVFMGVGISSTLVPELKLDGLLGMFSKTLKWLLSFVFTMFSAFLGFRTLISTSVDSVSTRAIRFTMSSFVPVVGAALAEAYKTVQGSVNVLKNGIGVFVIFAVAVVFMPIVLRLVIWLFSLNLCKCFAQIISLRSAADMLGIISTVLSVLLAIIICIVALYIIATALIITVGGNRI